MTRTTRTTRARTTGAAAIAIVTALVLVGCSSSNDSLSRQYGNGSTQNYISGTGAVTEVAVDERTDPIDFTAESTEGDELSAEALRGDVVVINFWYAGCPPCRAEAEHLNTVHDRFADDDVQFIGVNVRDEAGTAKAFERKFGVDYPTVLDANTGTMQLALSGEIAPNAVPTTIVLDKQGRVAARVLGAVDGPGILDTLVGDELTGKAS
ncbi:MULTISPECIES: TlpA disulfide reductase family protein [unclassified Curtobacterium]|uniref:TlpA family protein disulfide reductase n=1 Tax=unclassified Curtobacterium TaxID=257496 RepID=UPI000DA7F8E3|nr:MULTISPECIES: TlpA disulfide reductase family protein [unclassified Curtobacterium]PZE68225.1 TlpA family protein disulfide reductase [Curtobacterium sp. MCBD17_021]WIB25525.1 TlpA disulfide reductase family protein [Curtobacterium sp. MCSS17_015]